MKTFTEIISAFGGYARFADEVGVSRNKAAVWRHRNSIPSGHWLEVVRAAERNGIAITVDMLAEIAAGRHSGQEAA